MVTGVVTRNARRNVTGIPDHKRHMDQLPVQRFAMGSEMMLPQRFTMVGGDDHERIVLQAAPAEFFHQPPDVIVNVLHAVVVCVHLALLRP